MILMSSTRFLTKTKLPVPNIAPQQLTIYGLIQPKTEIIFKEGFYSNLPIFFWFVSSRFEAKKVKKALKPKSITTYPGGLTLLQKIAKFPKSLILVKNLNFFFSHNFYTFKRLSEKNSKKFSHQKN